MRLLHAVEDSVLWLAEANPEMAANLRREAQRCGIDGGRIVIAPRLPLAEHMARERLADLFLDTIHTTQAPRPPPRFGPGCRIDRTGRNVRRPDGGQHAACRRVARARRRVVGGLRGAGAQDRQGSGVPRLLKDKLARNRESSPFLTRAFHPHIETPISRCGGPVATVIGQSFAVKT